MFKRNIVANEPIPCRKFQKKNVVEIINHIKEDKCLTCLAVVRCLQREYEITEALWNRRN